jgi:hypothetical protein
VVSLALGIAKLLEALEAATDEMLLALEFAPSAAFESGIPKFVHAFPKRCFDEELFPVLVG